MREIKFRVWDIQKEKFIPSEVYAMLNRTDFNAFGVMTKDWENYCEGEYFYDNAQILQQFTGLKDKNGVEIYEGDVVIVEGKPYNKVKNEVKWGAKSHSWKLYQLEGSQHKYYSLGNSNKIEIIGNIHEK